MAHNLLVSFELRDWLRQGALIVAAIEEFGPATRIFSSTWFVCSDAPAEQLACSVQQVMGATDALLVVDLEASVAAMFNVDERSVQFLRGHWRPAGVAGLRAERDAHESRATPATCNGYSTRGSSL